MNCDQAKQMIHGLLDGDLDEADANSLDRHTLQCPSCARYREQLRRIDHLARELRPDSPPARFTERVMVSLSRPQPAAVGSHDFGIVHFAALLAGLLIASLVMSAWFDNTVAVSDWGTQAAIEVRDSVSATATDVAAGVDKATAMLATLWRSVERFQRVLPTVWLMAAAATAFLLLVTFNMVGVRAIVRNT